MDLMMRIWLRRLFLVAVIVAVVWLVVRGG